MDNETIRRVNTGHAERIAALEQKLADMTADYHRWHQAYCDAKYPESVPLSWQQNAARVAELEIENAALRHDLERCMARELALLNPPQSDASDVTQ